MIALLGVVTIGALICVVGGIILTAWGLLRD